MQRQVFFFQICAYEYLGLDKSLVGQLTSTIYIIQLTGPILGGIIDQFSYYPFWQFISCGLMCSAELTWLLLDKTLPRAILFVCSLVYGICYNIFFTSNNAWIQEGAL